MFHIANELLANGQYIERKATECCEGDKNKTFFCPYCGVRVFLNLPKEKSGISPYFSAGSESHKIGCKYYKKNIFQKVSHLDQTGADVNLEKLMTQFHDRSAHSPSNKEKGKAEQMKEKEIDTAEDQEKSIVRVARRPSTLMELYGVLENRSASNNYYAGQRKELLIVDKKTISYHYDHTLDHTALIVGKRCRPPNAVAQYLCDKNLYSRCLTIKSPYSVPVGKKGIYYILVFKNKQERSKIIKMFMQQLEKGRNPKYLAMATWKPCLQRNRYNAYIGILPNEACFHVLDHKDDCDDD